MTSREAPGTCDVGIAVTDGTHAATQQWTVTVVDGPSNAAPVFTSSPLKQAVLNQPFRYTAVAHDPERYEVSYTLLSGPSGMTLDAHTGALNWTPSSLPPGNTASVALSAADPQGNTAQQAFILTPR